MCRHVRYRALRFTRHGLVPLLALICLILSQVAPVGPFGSVPVAHAAGNPVISSVLITTTVPTPTITITGSNFGTSGPSAPATPCTNIDPSYTGNNYGTALHFIDYSRSYDAGLVDPINGRFDFICLVNPQYTGGTQISFTLGSFFGIGGYQLNTGDAFTVWVEGVPCSITVNLGTEVSCAPPAITSVAFSNASSPPSVTVTGNNLGSQPAIYGSQPDTAFGCNPSYTGSNYAFQQYGFNDNTVPWISGQADPTGGTVGNCIGITYSSYSPTQVAFTFGTAYGTNGWILSAGDAFTVYVAGARCSGIVNFSTAIACNYSWDTALPLWADTATGAQSTSLSPSIDALGQERWYDFPVQPGAQVHIGFNGPAGSAVSLHTDIRQLYNELTNPSTASQVATDLAIQDAPSGYLPSGYLPSGYLPSGYLPSGYLPSGYLPSGYLPSGYLPSGYLPSGYLPSGYLPSGYLPSGYLPSGYLPSGYLPSGYLPSGYLPSGYLPGAYASVPRQSLMAIATSPTATALSIDRNTWDLTGHLYIRVVGPVGSFTLAVSENGGVCGSIVSVSGSNGTLPTTTVNGGPPQTLILWDSTRWDATRAGDSASDVSTLQSKMAAFAGRTDVNGQVIDLHQFPRVVSANSQADSNATCPAAKNLAATEIKSIVQGYRNAYQASGKTTLKYIVLVGDDHSIPFFRYPDDSGLAPENGYIPPVSDGSPTQASLRNNYVLGQDEYGSSTSIPRGDHSLPIPDIAVGRLVDTAAEASHMLDAYTAANGVITPGSALVTGYDFVADAATSASAELSAGINQAGCSTTNTCVSPDQLIAKQGAPPTDPSIWTADALRQQLYGKRHDIVFMAGHFSAGNLLASDYSTQLSAAEVAGSAANLTNALVLALGCHGGLNIPGQDAVAGVSPAPDWPEAMAEKGATLLAATGYAYGDTVLTEYGERLFVDVARQLRTGTGNVPIGVANVAAKQDYLNTHVDLGGIDEKTVLETTLYGLPMLQVNMPGQRLVASTSNSIVGAATTVAAAPGAGLGLSVGQTGGSSDIDVAPTTTLNTTQLTDASGNNPVTASWLSGVSGVVAHPLDPVFPLQLYNATVPNQVLRGIGFRGGSFTDLTGKTPLTVAPSTETSVGHPAFFSDVLYPTQVWSANYFDTVDGLNGGLTSLAVAPAQYQSSSPGSTSGTIRQFTDLKFRLYYLSTSALASQIAAGPALDPAPNIIGATTTNDSSGTVTFQVRVQNSFLPSGAQDLQDVWVTYNDPSSTTPHQWLSVDLTQSANDPSLWTGTASGLSNGTVYLVQAANATGLVSLNTNNGAYFTIAPATPPTQVTPTLTLQSPPASGAYESSAQFTVNLQSGGNGIAGQAVGVHLGSQEAIAATDSNGQATVTLPLGQSPGSYTVWASYSGATVSSTTAYNAVSSSVTTFTISPAPTTLGLSPASASATYSSSESTGIVATLLANGIALAQKSVFFTITGNGLTIHKVTITDAGGNAALGTLSLPAGSYTVSAAFGTTSPDPNYAGSSAPTTTTLTITQASQTISFGPLPNHLLGDAPFTVNATGGGSGNPVTFGAGPGTVCTSSGTNGATITLVGVGNCTVTANQVGNANYHAAAAVTQSFTVAYPPLYMTMAVTSSPPGPVTTGSTVTDSFSLGNHTTATQTVSVRAALTYTGIHGSQTVTIPFTLNLKAGQTISQSVGFPITKSFPRGTYMLTLTANDGSGHTATSSATLTVV